MTLKLVLDRFEEGIGVCLNDDNQQFLISGEILQNVKENDIFTIEFDGESFHSPKVLVEETEKKKSDVSKRMKRLFNMYHRRPPKL